MHDCFRVRGPLDHLAQRSYWNKRARLRLEPNARHRQAQLALCALFLDLDISQVNENINKLQHYNISEPDWPTDT